MLSLVFMNSGLLQDQTTGPGLESNFSVNFTDSVLSPSSIHSLGSPVYGVKVYKNLAEFGVF